MLLSTVVSSHDSVYITVDNTTRVSAGGRFKCSLNILMSYSFFMLTFFACFMCHVCHQHASLLLCYCYQLISLSNAAAAVVLLCGVCVRSACFMLVTCYVPVNLSVSPSTDLASAAAWFSPELPADSRLAHARLSAAICTCRTHSHTKLHVFKLLRFTRLPVRRGPSATAVGARRTADW